MVINLSTDQANHDLISVIWWEQLEPRFFQWDSIVWVKSKRCLDLAQGQKYGALRED